MSENYERPDGSEFAGVTDPLIQKTIRLEKDAARWKREETALRDMEGRYLALLENPLFIVMILSEGRVNFLNTLGEAFFGFSALERPRFLLSDYVAPGYGGAVEELLGGGDTLWDRQAAFPVVDEKGREKWLKMAVTPVDYRGEASILAVGGEIPPPREENSLRDGAEEKIPSYWEAENVLVALTDKDCKILFASEAFRREAGALWVGSPEAGVSLWDILPEGDEGLPFRLAAERALAGEGGEVGREAGDCNFSLSFAPTFTPEGVITGLSLSLCEKSAEQAAEKKVRAEEEKFRRLFSLTSDMAVVATREEGRIIEYNQSFLEKTGLYPMRPEGRDLDELGLLPFESMKGLIHNEIGERGAARDLECLLTLPSGEERPVLFSAIPLEREGRQVLLITMREALLRPSKGAAGDGYVLSGPAPEISEGAVEAIPVEQTVETGEVAGKERFLEVLARRMEQAGDSKDSISLILLDIDGYKGLAEDWDRQAEDDFLQEFIATVRAGLGKGDFLGSLGRGEYAVAVQSRGYLACQMAEKLRDTLVRSRLLPRRAVFCSFGVCEFRKEMSLEEFMRRTAIALREAKRAGGNRVVLSPSVL